MLVVNSTLARHTRDMIQVMFLRNQRVDAANIIQGVWKSYVQSDEILSVSAEFREAEQKAAEVVVKARRKKIKKARNVINREGGGSNSDYTVLNELDSSATKIQMMFKRRVNRRVSVKAEQQAIEDRRAEIDASESEERSRTDPWAWTKTKCQQSCCSPNINWEAIEAHSQKSLRPHRLPRVFRGTNANMLIKLLMKGLILIGSLVAIVNGSSSVTSSSSSIIPNKSEVDKMRTAITTIIFGGLFIAILFYFNNRNKNVLQDVDAAHPPELIQFVDKLVKDRWDYEKNVWKPDPSNPTCSCRTSRLCRNCKEQFKRLVVRTIAVKKTDAQISAMFTYMLSSARGITREAASTLGKKRGDEASKHPNQTKKYRESLTCADVSCDNTVNSNDHSLGLWCHQCTCRKLQITISENGKMTSPSWPRQTVRNANWSSTLNSWVVPTAYRIPTHLDTQQQRAILTKLKGVKSSTHCTICPTRGRHESPNTCIYGTPNTLTKCTECTEEIHDIEYSTIGRGNNKQHLTHYNDHDGDRMSYKRPGHQKTFPLHLYALHELSNEATVAVACMIEDRRSAHASNVNNRRQDMYQRRREQFQRTQAYSREAYRTSLEHENITPRDFIFRDPTTGQDYHADQFVARMRAGGEPFAYVHITAVEFSEEGMQAYSRDPADPSHNFPSGRHDRDGLLTLKPNGVFTNGTIARILHLTDGVENNTDMKTWATIGLSNAIAFFERKYRHVYPLVNGFVGHAHIIYDDNTRAGDYHQTVVTSPINNVTMVASSCEMLAGCQCNPDGPFVEPDLVLKFTCTNNSGDPRTFDWRVVKVDGQMVNIALDDSRLTADKCGISYTPGAVAAAAAVNADDSNVVDLTVDTP